MCNGHVSIACVNACDARRRRAAGIARAGAPVLLRVLTDIIESFKYIQVRTCPHRINTLKAGP